jgi:hypothetical protein
MAAGGLRRLGLQSIARRGADETIDPKPRSGPQEAARTP